MDTWGVSWYRKAKQQEQWYAVAFEALFNSWDQYIDLILVFYLKKSVVIAPLSLNVVEIPSWSLLTPSGLPEESFQQGVGGFYFMALSVSGG